MVAKALRVGARVRVPWGLSDDVEGEIIEVWGDPPTHVRVLLWLDDDSDPAILLLSPDVVAAA